MRPRRRLLAAGWAALLLVFYSAAGAPAGNDGPPRPADPPRGRAWDPGTLDPARDFDWTERSTGEIPLARLRLAPRAVYYITRGDPARPSALYYFTARFNPDGSLTIEPLHGHSRVCLLLDFGRVFPGNVEFLADPQRGVGITVETGEAAQALRAYSAAPAPDGSIRRFTADIAQAGWTGLRYAWIRFDGVRRPFTVYRMAGVLQIYAADYQGEFRSSDEGLNRIWEMCAWSAHTSMGQPVGPDPTPRPVLLPASLDRVDRRPWAGDHRVIQETVAFLFGEYGLLRDALEGLFPAGTRPVPALQNIPAYSLDWGLALVDYYRCSGDAAFFKRRLFDLEALIETFSGPFPPGWHFIDWDRRVDGVTGALAVERRRKAFFAAKLVHLCREAAWAAERAGFPDEAAVFLQKAEAGARAWAGDFPERETELGLHALTWLVLADMLEPSRFPEIYRAAFADRLGRCPGTPFFAGSVLQALGRMRRYDAALEFLRDYWGGMIEAGATAPWEEWHPGRAPAPGLQPPQYGPPFAWGGSSLNHAAGSGPARWLLEQVLGVSAEEPGFARARIHPRPAGLTWVEGSVATPLGALAAGWKRESDRFDLTLRLPPGCRGATVVIPALGAYRVDGLNRVPLRQEQGEAVFELGPGEHRLEAASR